MLWFGMETGPGAEALNGMILFGLTTAFLYGMIRRLLIERGE
jgi:hypothetical protein